MDSVSKKFLYLYRALCVEEGSSISRKFLSDVKNILSSDDYFSLPSVSALSTLLVDLDDDLDDMLYEAISDVFINALGRVSSLPEVAITL